MALDLHSPEAVAASYERMAASLGPVMTGVVVQEMVGPGVDVRVTLDPAPVVGAAIGLGIGGAIGPITRRLHEAYFAAVRGRDPRFAHWLTPIPSR